jgi:sugar/nucleoside kinase (ribokinase family)
VRAQVVVLGPIERELYVRLNEDLLPSGIKRAEEISWRITGCGVEVAERLSRLGLSAAIVTGIGGSREDRDLLAALRKRGVQVRGARSGARATPMTVRVRSPRDEVRIVSSVSHTMASKQVVLRSLPGSRHFHVCGSVLSERASWDTAAQALARAASSGASTSLDARRLAAASPWEELRRLASDVDVLFTDSETLRALTDRARIGDAAEGALALGPRLVAAGLRSGGSRVYFNGGAIRIPSFGREVASADNAFVSGCLLGWLLGARSEVCGVLGAAAALDAREGTLPDRRALASRLREARKNPEFSKLVPELSDAGKLLDRTRRLPRRDLAKPRRGAR